MTTFLNIFFSGVAAGAAYSLVALGFVIIYKATGVINFAQGGLMLIGGYMAYNCHVTWGLPFWLAFLVAIAVAALVGAVIEEAILRFMVGQPVFAQLMVTIGLLFVIQEVVDAIWGSSSLDMASPWGNQTVQIGGATVSQISLWTILFAFLALVAFFLFFRYSRLGLSMRATALDQEAALAQGISARRVYAVSWAISGGVAAIAAIMLSAQPGGLNPSLQVFALLAFPAIILGGLDSPGGAVVGGLVIGLSQAFAARYMHWGQGWADVFPYVIMIVVLLVRPYGLFGTKEVRRV